MAGTESLTGRLGATPKTSHLWGQPGRLSPAGADLPCGNPAQGREMLSFEIWKQHLLFLLGFLGFSTLVSGRFHFSPQAAGGPACRSFFHLRGVPGRDEARHCGRLRGLWFLCESAARGPQAGGVGFGPREASPPGNKARGPEVMAGRRRVHIPADTTVSRRGGTGPLVAKTSFMQPPERP